jgi:hypothetical protein
VASKQMLELEPLPPIQVRRARQRAGLFPGLL